MYWETEMPRITLDPEPIRPGGDLFKADRDWWLNAVLPAYDPSWYVYTEGYRRAADCLIQQLMRSRHEIDFLVYPIIFLYRQYLELSLKVMIRDAEEVLDHEEGPPRTHDLRQLWSRCRKRIEKALDTVSSDELNVIDNCIQQFSALDSSSEGFRYPERKDGSPVQHSVTHINLRNLMDEMANAANVIESAGNILSVVIDQKREFESEYGW
jgi:HEPN domain-containing protein